MTCLVLSVCLSVEHTSHKAVLSFVAAFFFELSSSTEVHFRDMCITFELPAA